MLLEFHYPTLSGAGEADVAIVGAGIVGLTTAYLLAQAGLSVAILETQQIGRQVTGRSTPKITNQHSLIYRHLIDTMGIDQARRYADANRTASRQIRTWIAELVISCDLEPKDAYTFSSDPGHRADIEREAQAARMVGFDAQVLDRAPLPFDTACALKCPDEAQFNPVQYLLAAAAAATGARVFENARVTAVDSSRRRWRVTAGSHSLDFENVIMASALPFAGPRDFDYGRRTQPRCHAATAFRIASGAIDRMFISIDQPTHSLRMGRDRNNPLLVALGPRFNTGQDGDVAEQFRSLESWIRHHLPVGDAEWRWVNEDYDTADRVPLVSMKEGFYLATGFNGWGISNGTAAGMLIADCVRGRSNFWAKLYDDTRSYPDDFNATSDSQSLVPDIDSIAPGQGGVLTRGKQKIAVWKDADGQAPCSFSLLHP